MEWAHWFENHEQRTVRQERVSERYGVSTVFLGIDHRFGEEGPPLLFETMVFEQNMESVDIDRYATWDEAVAGHEAMVEKWRSK